MNRLKLAIYEIIEDDVKDSLAHRIFEIFIITLIILNVLSIICESFLGNSNIAIQRFEEISIVIFTIEYLLRFWTAGVKYSGQGIIRSRLKFVFSPVGLVDLISILPFYITYFLPFAIDGRILRILRLLRLLRILKLARFLDSFRIIKKVFNIRKYELLITGFIAMLVVVVSATLMYEIEHDAQPDKFPDVLSAFWWAIVTLTTIGYGDVFPITSLGKFIGGVVAVVGVGLIALPTAIISSSFIDEYRNHNGNKEAEEKKENKTEEKEKFTYCPHCGKKLNEH